MIHALKLIGDYVQKTSDESLLSQVVDNPNANGQYENVLIIVFEIDKNEVIFSEITIEEFAESKLDKYAYKYGSPRGGDLTPTSKITELEKTFKKRIKYPLENLSENLKEESENKKIILGIYDILQDEEEAKEIFDKLEAQFSELDNRSVLTIAVRDEKNNKLKYVGDFPEFTNSLMKRYERKFYYRSSYNKADKESVGHNNVCYICGNKSEKTYGYVGTYSFYTLDKPGFTSGGFKRGEAWKNYPVCPECAKNLDLGKEFIEDYLSSRFCGVNYSIIPKPIFDFNDENKKYFFETLKYLEKHKKMSLQEDTRERLTTAQDELIYLMKDFDNYINFNLMFYEEQNSAFRILLYVEDVLPSYIQKIFKAKEKVEEEKLFNDLMGTDGEMFSLKFKFNLISNFFYVNQTNKPDYTEQFLGITDKIFSGRTISYHLLIKRFIEHIREKFRNDEPTWFDNLKAIMILKFLKNLNLLPAMGGEADILESTTENNFRSKIESFLIEHKGVFNNNVKILVFLEGVLAKKLLNVQRRETNGATPFRGRLNSLKLNEKIIKRIYTEAINKLEEYNKNYYVQLEEMIADYIIKSDFSEISNNELSFYFVTGMNQAQKFKFKKKKEDE